MQRSVEKIDEGVNIMKGEAASTSKRILDRKSEFKTGKLDLPGPLAQPPKCPECTSQRVWKDGLRKTNSGDVQRYLCRICGYRFSQTEPKNHSEPLKKPSSWSINNASTINLDRQVCEFLTEDSKNLAKVQSRTEKQAAGATKPDKATVKGKIVEFAWHLKRQGYSEQTIKTYVVNLERLLKHGANLFDGESVKEVIAQQESWSTTTKHVAVTSYTAFTAFNGIAWNPPSYKPQTKLPFIPLESEIDALIASAGKKLSTILQLLKETAMRIGEACRLKWIDIDLANNVVTVNNPEKHGNPRMLRISNKLAAMLNALPKTTDTVFGKTKPRDAATNLMRMRKRVATKLQNPRINYIHLHTLRHWKATMEYHKTKDILHIMKMLGHRNIQTTLIYTQLINFESDKFHVRVANNLKEDKELVEAGFEFITEREGVKIYRKRK